MRALLMIIFTVLWKDTWHLTLVIWMSSLSLWLDRTHGNVIKPKPVQGVLTMCLVICQWCLRCFQCHQNLLSDGLISYQITDQTAWYRWQIIHSEIMTSNNPVKKTNCLSMHWLEDQELRLTNKNPKIFRDDKFDEQNQGKDWPCGCVDWVDCVQRTTADKVALLKPVSVCSQL